MVFFLFKMYNFYCSHGGDCVEFDQYLQIGNGASADIFDAALQNDAAYILKYKNQGNDLFITDQRQQTLLHLATRNKSLDALSLLLKIGLNPNNGDRFGDTPLHIASFMGDADSIKLLLAFNANPNTLNNKLQTPLHQASFKGSVRAIKVLLKNGANIYIEDEAKTSVMQYAVRSKKIKAVKYLVEQGAIINSLDIQKKSVMHYAALYSRVDIVKYLMEQGVNPYGKTSYDLTPLHLAIEHPEIDMVNTFLASGLTSYDKTKFGLSPYDEALQKNKFEAVELFNKLKNDKEYQSKVKRNALSFAIVRNDFDQADSLIPRSNVNLRDIFDNTALFYAIMNEEPYLVESLIKNDASIYAIDRMGLDAIYYAVLIGNENIVKAIMKKQVNINKKYLGYTVVEYSKFTNNQSLLETLKKGA